MFVDIGLKFYAFTTHLSDTLRSRSWVIDFDKFSGKAQVRRATLSCDSSYYRRPNILKYDSLMKSKNNKILISVSKFIKIIYEICK